MTTTQKTNLRIAFWGTSRFSIIVLEEMAREGFFPSLIITAPAKPKGRGLELAPSEVKIWADAHHIPTLEPHEIRSNEFMQTLGVDWDLFLVVSYGKIIPRAILNMSRHSALNVHPSLLPKLRGASPIQSAILEDVPVNTPHETGVTIMLIDEEVDHGPIVAQEKITIENWPPKGSELEETLGVLGGKLLVKTIPRWTTGEIIPQEQDHEKASYVKKITKQSGHIDLTDDPARMYRKIRAFDIWPRTYFLFKKKGGLRPGRESADSEIRVVVTEAHLEDGKLILDRVIPEGKREMDYVEFLRGQR